MALSFDTTYLIASRLSVFVGIDSGMYLRLRLVNRLALRFRVLDDGNWDPCNKRASVPFTTSLYDNFYLRLRHLLEVISKPSGYAQPWLNLRAVPINPRPGSYVPGPALLLHERIGDVGRLLIYCDPV